MGEKLIALDTHRGMLLEINPQGVVERQFRHTSLTNASEIVAQNDHTILVLGKDEILEFVLPEN